MKALHMVTFILVAVGGLNWGLVGLGALMGDPMGWNVVNMVLGSWPMVESLVYLLVGLSTVWVVVGHPKECKMCMGGSM
jgi:hypothetical protein